jgi:hypothetical protein
MAGRATCKSRSVVCRRRDGLARVAGKARRMRGHVAYATDRSCQPWRDRAACRSAKIRHRSDSPRLGITGADAAGAAPLIMTAATTAQGLEGHD